MSNTKQLITDSEYAIMKVLWQSAEKLTVADVCAGLSGKEWTPSTVSTLLQRLAKKEVIGFEKRGKAHYYFPILKKDEYSVNETRSLIQKLYDGSLKNLVAALTESKAISKNEIAELKEMFNLNEE